MIAGVIRVIIHNARLPDKATAIKQRTREILCLKSKKLWNLLEKKHEIKYGVIKKSEAIL
ncbi:hypothetical protein D3C77_800920 [compost metagenome]